MYDTNVYINTLKTEGDITAADLLSFTDLFFVVLIFRYETGIFQRKEKLHSDRKKGNKRIIANIISGDRSILQRKFTVSFMKICCEQSKFYLVC